MNFAIIGSRSFDDYKALKSVMDWQGRGLVKKVVSGGARGADLLGEKWAKEKNIPVEIFKPDWDKYGKKAGFIRNELIIKEADVVIAFWDGVSKGTRHSISLAHKYRKILVVIYI